MGIGEFWIDGFNLFHSWEVTRESFAGQAADPARVQERALRSLARLLGRRSARTTVFLDGGLWRESRALGDLRVQWAGPGQSADRLMEEGLAGRGPAARSVAAVTDDRLLARNLALLGAIHLTNAEYLGWIEKRQSSAPAPLHGPKYRALSPAEVDGWLEYFGGE